VLYGAGRSHDRLIGITLGTGMGSAFIADGKAVHVGKGVFPGGELYPALYNGERADDLFSTRGLKSRLEAAGLAWQDVKTAAEAAHTHGGTREVFAQFGTDLGAFLTPHVQAFGAELVLVLGGISQAFDLFREQLNAALPIRAARGTLGAQAALLGAANLFL